MKQQEHNIFTCKTKKEKNTFRIRSLDPEKKKKKNPVHYRRIKA